MEQQPAAPAPTNETPAPATISATRDAANRGDLSAFMQAHEAAQRGRDVARVEVKAEPAAAIETPAAPEPQPTISKRQQAVNDSIRQAVDSATAHYRAEIDRLQARLSTAPAQHQQPQAPQAQPQAQPTQAEYERYLAMPDAPKEENFSGVDGFQRYTAAMGLFIAKKFHEEQQTRAAQHQTQEQLTAAQRARVDGFIGRLDAAKGADPEFVAKLTPEVRALKPFDALQPGEAGGPHNVVAEQIFDSPIAPQMLLHLSQHPEELVRLITMPDHIAALPRAARHKAHIQFIVREYGRLEGQIAASAAAPAQATQPAVSTISAAPPPAPQLTRATAPSDPKAAALSRDDFRGFLSVHTQERLAAKG